MKCASKKGVWRHPFPFINSSFAVADANGWLAVNVAVSEVDRLFVIEHTGGIQRLCTRLPEGRN